ncbi:MAG: DUF6263 family protein [Flavobacteriales bacterium]
MRKIICYQFFQFTLFNFAKIGVFSFLIILSSSCSVNSRNQDPILLRLKPEIGSTYEVNTNMNIALDMKQPINVNMDFFIKSRFDSVRHDGKLAMTSEISRIKSIVSSGVFHRSYDTQHPIIENEIEQEMHDKLSKLVGVKMNTLMNNRGETEQITDLDTLFKNDEEMKKQFKEIEKSFSNSGVVFPSEEVKKGSIWTAEIRKKSVQNMIQKITYKVRKITVNEVYIDISGTISYGSDDVKGGGKIKGMMRVNRSTGLNTTTKIIQDYKMNINGYKAKGINTIESKTTLIEE